MIAPGKTPRGPSDRVKTDRKDAELLARQLLGGSLTSVVVPPVEVEAAREMTRAHDVCRQELMRARHRVSKMLLRHGVVYPKTKTWTAEHRPPPSAPGVGGLPRLDLSDSAVDRSVGLHRTADATF